MWNSAFWILLADWVLIVVFSVLIILRTRTVGATLAWLMVILLFPFGGAIIYLLLGENRLSKRRAQWAIQRRRDYARWRSRQIPHQFDDWQEPSSDLAQMSRMIMAASESIPLNGNRLELLKHAEDVFKSLIVDIDQAQATCYMEYYIWEVGGQADELADRLILAAQRGVDCKVLVDAVGSGGFWRSKQAKRMRAAGVQLHAALPVNLFRALLYRFDLRLHRKLVVIDDKIGYTGSQNMADPKFFRRGAGFGQWVDAMVRIEGPAVDALLMIFVEDWHYETDRLPHSDSPETKFPPPQAIGKTVVQVVPSGPGLDAEAIVQILIGAIYSADHQLIITTPYLVPDESLQRALISAARRGVEVTIVIPQRVDSRLVRLASQAPIRELVAAGIRVARYRKGMLHTKSISIDGEISIFGSLNLDPRSIQLNFELMLVMYEQQFTKELLSLQAEYLSHSDLMPSDQKPPTLPIRFLESCARLISPLL
jgi:cardiolipin synthase A/B